MNDKIDHPAHYGGNGNPYEAILVIEAWDAGFCLGNALKYIARAGKKGGEHVAYDLGKAVWYLNRVVSRGARSRDHVTPFVRRTIPASMNADAVIAAWGLEPPLAAVLSAIYDGQTPHALRLLREVVREQGAR